MLMRAYFCQNVEDTANDNINLEAHDMGLDERKLDREHRPNNDRQYSEKAAAKKAVVKIIEEGCLLQSLDSAH
jgi:hypothetical protein